MAAAKNFADRGECWGVMMPIEIERKYLVRSDGWQEGAVGPARIVQGYFSRSDRLIGRVRKLDGRAFLAIKETKIGFSRHEFEYEIPNDDAEEMLALFCKGALIYKDRFETEFAGRRWMIDRFDGDNRGLVVAEVELVTEADEVVLPDWVEGEVTGMACYRNSNLASFPFQAWTQSDRWTVRPLEEGRMDTVPLAQNL